MVVPRGTSSFPVSMNSLELMAYSKVMALLAGGAPGDVVIHVGVEHALADWSGSIEGADVVVLAAPVFVEAGVGEHREKLADETVDEVLDEGEGIALPLGYALGAVVEEGAEEVEGGVPPRGPGAMRLVLQGPGLRR